MKVFLPPSMITRSGVGVLTTVQTIRRIGLSIDSTEALEDVRADPGLGTADGLRQGLRSGAPTTDHGNRDAGLVEQLPRAIQEGPGALAGGIGHQSAKLEARELGDGPPESQRRFWGLDAAALAARVQLDEHRDLTPRGLRLLRDPARRRFGVHGDDDCRVARETHKPLDLPWPNDVVRYQYILDSGGDHCLGLSELLAGYASGPRSDLHPGDLGDLVALGVHSEVDLMPAACLRQVVDVPLQYVEVERQGRCVQVVHVHGVSLRVGSVSRADRCGNHHPAGS